MVERAQPLGLPTRPDRLIRGIHIGGLYGEAASESVTSGAAEAVGKYLLDLPFDVRTEAMAKLDATLNPIREGLPLAYEQIESD